MRKTYLCFLEKRNALHLPVFSIFFSTAIPEYRGILSKKYFTDHRTVNTIQLFVAIKGIFSGQFFGQVAAKGNYP